MATNDDYAELRRKTGETGSDTYTNTDLEKFITQANGDLNGAASLIWGEKASANADLVNISEAGSARSNSDLFRHAEAQRDYFLSISTSGASAAATGSRTRRIVRT
jgi:hypothetical protein